ncbi:MAG TPA: ABC transporter permease [Candidatus Acetothermia bacterium]|nr:ABC transporter permease [Candidatus Acetothermia bacterium]
MRTFKRLFIKNPVGMASGIILSVYVLVALFAPLIAPPLPGRSPYEIPRDGFAIAPCPPSPEHWFGTTEGQYDIFYGVVWGTRTAFKIAGAVVIFGFLLGILIGGMSGYFGGLVDEVTMRITDIFLSFPFLLAAMVLATVLGKGLGSMIIALLVFRWMTYARLARSEVLRLKEIAFVEAARAMGASHRRILLRHVMPNSVYPALIQASMDVGRVVMSASALSFLGLGVEAGYADWGQLISMARNWILGGAKGAFEYWYTLFFPGGALFLFVLSWNILGDALRDIFDPRMRGVL